MASRRSLKTRHQRLVKTFKERLHKALPELEDGDLMVTPTGVPGDDLALSPKAAKAFPYSVEAKHYNKMAIYKHWEQCTKRADEQGTKALLHIKANHKPPLVVISEEEFFLLYEMARELDEQNLNQ